MEVKCPKCAGSEIWIDEMKLPAPDHCYANIHCMDEKCGHRFGFDILQCSGGVDVIGLDATFSPRP